MAFLESPKHLLDILDSQNVAVFLRYLLESSINRNLSWREQIVRQKFQCDMLQILRFVLANVWQSLALHIQI